ncbi:MAG: IS21 family transposase [candidate division Zixibacteria bacterium]|nr:IS21 family transposase [candidate division Zixibacteria bacterium]
MANQLKVAVADAIIGLLEHGWSYRRIARELGVHRETVARYDRLRRSSGSKPSNPTPGSDGENHSKPANVTPGSSGFWTSNYSPGPPSFSKPFEDIIKKKLDCGLSSQRIWQDLVSEHGFTGSYSSVKRFVRRLGEGTPLPFRRMECEPGQEAQVDFGTGAWMVDEDGKKRRTHVLRIILSHSRKGYSEAVLRQTTENFIRVLENAFHWFGGVPKVLVIDNLKAAVKNPDWFDPDLNPKVVEFARHYGFVFMPTKPYMPRHKGKIESGIKYVKNNALKARQFASLAEHNQFLARWERQVADTRIHGTTRQQVGRHFREVEQPALMPLTTERFPFYDEGKRKVNRDGHIGVARAYYSVPPEYLGYEVWVRWDSRLVRIYNDRLEQIAVHARALPGKFHTDRKHLADKKISSVERGAEYMLSKAIRLGDDAGRWASTMISVRGIEGVRVLQGFLSLARKHPANVINQASRAALEANCFRLRPLRQLCKNYSEAQSELFFDEDHPIIRPLSEYQELLPKQEVSFRIEEQQEEER